MGKVGKFLQFSVGLATVVALATPAVTWAQAAKEKRRADGGVEIEEITVTAQKREENVQEVPISVTALTGAALEEKGANSVGDLGQAVPNLFITQAGYGASNTVLSMRGTSNNDTGLSKNSTVGFYIDGVYIAKIVGNNFDVEDLDRVEVLRGPQGTLFGRNTSGGAVNMVTKKPTDERSITVLSEVGNYDAVKERLTVNVPLIGKNGFFQSDALGTLSLRENAVYRSYDGFYRNQSPTNLPASGGSELATLNRVFNMTDLRWQPTKDITVDYSFEYHRYRETPPYMAVTAVFPKGDPNYSALVNPGGPFDLTPYIRKNRVDAVGLNAQWDNTLKSHRLADDGNNRMHILTGAWDLGELGPLGSVTLKSISHYRNLRLNSAVDLDGSPFHILDQVNDDLLQTWSEEVQWVGTAPRIRYVLGAYYYGERSAAGSQQVLYGGGVNEFGRTTTKNSSYAPFGQITWTPPILNDKLSLTAGLRYSEDHIHSNRAFRCIYVTIPGLPPGVGPNFCNIGIPGLVNFSASVGRTFGREGPGFPGLTPMANISYQWTDDLMLYVRASRGYQSGTANDVVSNQSLLGTTAPERVESYEAGFKSQWLDNRVRLNADGFLSRYKDQVVPFQVFSPTAGLTSLNINAGKSEYWGSEVELTAIPLRGLEATANYAYLSAKFLEFPSQLTPGGPIVNVANQRKEEYTPPHTVTVGLTYTARPTTAGVFSAHVDTFWTASFVGHPEPPYPDAMWAYSVTNGRLQLVDIPLQKGSLDLAVFGRNLFDRKYRTNGFSLGSLGWAVDAYGDPRTFGVQLTYNFTE